MCSDVIPVTKQELVQAALQQLPSVLMQYPINDRMHFLTISSRLMLWHQIIDFVELHGETILNSCADETADLELTIYWKKDTPVHQLSRLHVICECVLRAVQYRGTFKVSDADDDDRNLGSTSYGKYAPTTSTVPEITPELLQHVELDLQCEVSSDRRTSRIVQVPESVTCSETSMVIKVDTWIPKPIGYGEDPNNDPPTVEALFEIPLTKLKPDFKYLTRFHKFICHQYIPYLLDNHSPERMMYYVAELQCVTNCHVAVVKGDYADTRCQAIINWMTSPELGPEDATLAQMRAFDTVRIYRTNLDGSFSNCGVFCPDLMYLPFEMLRANRYGVDFRLQVTTGWFPRAGRVETRWHDEHTDFHFVSSMDLYTRQLMELTTEYEKIPYMWASSGRPQLGGNHACTITLGPRKTEGGS